MSYIQTFIDSVADVQKNTLKTFVQDEQYRKPLASIVDAQTTLAKEVVKSAEGFVGKFKLASN